MCLYFVKMRLGDQKYCILRCLGCPGCAKNAKIWNVAGAPLQQKSIFAQVCVCCFAVFYLRKRQSVEVCVCLCAIRVCVFIAKNNTHILCQKAGSKSVQSVCVFTKTHTYFCRWSFSPLKKGRKHTHTWRENCFFLEGGSRSSSFFWFFGQISIFHRSFRTYFNG